MGIYLMIIVIFTIIIVFPIIIVLAIVSSNRSQ